MISMVSGESSTGNLKRQSALKSEKSAICAGSRTAAQCSKIRKKVQFHKYKNTLFAFSKMAKNQFLHEKKV